MATTDTGTTKSLLTRVWEWVTGASNDAPQVTLAGGAINVEIPPTYDTLQRVLRKVHVGSGSQRLDSGTNPLSDLQEVYKITNLGPGDAAFRFAGTGEFECVLAAGESLDTNYQLGHLWVQYRTYPVVIIVEGGR